MPHLLQSPEGFIRQEEPRFLIWWTQRKSPFASRQAAQALVYQLLGILVALAAWMTWGMLMLGSVFVPLLFDAQNPEALQPYTMIPALLLMVVPITVMLVWTGYGVYAAWRVWKGHDFSYPVLGRWIR